MSLNSISVEIAHTGDYILFPGDARMIFSIYSNAKYYHEDERSMPLNHRQSLDDRACRCIIVKNNNRGGVLPVLHIPEEKMCNVFES